MDEPEGIWWSATDDGIAVAVRVTPGGRRSELLEVTTRYLRVRVNAPAVEGKANAELRRFVAELFGVRRSAVTLVRGEHAREKTVHIAGIGAPPDSVRHFGALGDLGREGQPRQ